jgi:hypothetical protein
MDCALRGDIAVSTANEFGKAYFWELLELYSIEALLLPSTLNTVEHARSRHALDDAVRSSRARVQVLGDLGDRVMMARERLTLLLDVWNSPSLTTVYTVKAWKSAAIPLAAMATGLAELSHATEGLESGLRAEFGAGRLAPLLVPEGSDLPIAREMFGAMRGDDLT